MTATQLKKIAKNYKIKGYTKMTTDELVIAVAKAEADCELKREEERIEWALENAFNDWFAGAQKHMHPVAFEVIESFIRDNQEQATLYRGGLFSDEVKEVGQTITFGKIASWTTDYAVAESFANGEYKTADNALEGSSATIFVVDAKTGHANLETKINKDELSIYAYELCSNQKEWASASSTSYTVVKVEGNVVFLEQK